MTKRLARENGGGRQFRMVAVCLIAIFLTLALQGCGGLVGGAGGGSNLTITVSASKTSVQAGEAVMVGAQVAHAGGNPAVTWSLSGANCPNNCGALSSTANGETYTAPSFVSPGFTVNVTAAAVANTSKSATVTLTVNQSLDVSCPSGNEGVLNGQYAFLLRGGGKPGLVTIAGTFTADGKGNVTAGLEDINDNNSGPQTGLTIPAGTSLYTVGSDNRGCLGLVNSQNTPSIFRFALGSLSAGVATTGRFIEFDDATGNGTRAEGFLAKQNPSSFATALIQGNYAFGLAGPDSSSGRMVSVGVINANAGALANGNIDSNDASTVTSNITGVTGTYNVAANGRGTLTLSLGSGSNFVVYMVSAARFIAMATDTLSALHPTESGEFLIQTIASFTNASLNAPGVLSLAGFDNAASAPTAAVGSVTPNGTGGATVVLDENDGGTFTPLQSATVTYVASANGRTTTSGFNHSPVLYLIAPNSAFVMGTDATVTFGRLEPQTGGPFNVPLLNGSYGYGTEGTDVGHRLTAVGSVQFDGIGNVTTTEDDSSPAGLMPNIPFGVAQYSFLATSSPPGRGTLDTSGRTVAYIVSPTKLVYINPPATNPRIVIVEK